jgi:four helix bundle protein
MQKAIKSYEDLDVYQLAFDLAIMVHHLSLGFPKFEQYGLGDQIRRASRSICANLAEGFARRAASVQEFKRFLSIAFGSAEEVRVWLSFAERLGYGDGDKIQDIKSQYIRVSKMLRSLGKAWLPKPQR